jgi:hypothetical protein
MWIPTYHVFPSRAAFLVACDAAGWPRGPDGKPMPPEGATLVEIGPIVAPPSIGPDGVPVPGDVLDARYHVNAAWHGTEPPEAFRAGAVTPKTPSRSFALPPPPPPVEPPVPAVIPAWKGLAWLEQAGLLDAATTAAGAGSPVARLAFRHAAEWHRDSPLIAALAAGLGLDSTAIDTAFRAADAIRG